MGTLKVKEAGVWNPLGLTSADEVHVGPDTPVSGSVDLWYDTDEDAAYVDSVNQWNSAWGVVAVGTFKATSHALASGVQTTITNPITANLQAGRRYRVSVTSRAFGTNAQTYVRLILLVNTVAIDLGNTILLYGPGPTNLYEPVNYQWLITGDGTNKTFDVAVTCNATPGTIYTESPTSFFYVEDVGPVTRAGISPPEGQPMLATAGNALGVVAVGSTTDNIVTLTTSPGAPLTTVLTFTPQVGRRYRIRYQVRAISCSDNASGYVSTWIDGANVSLSDSWFSGTTNYAGRVFDWLLPPADGLTHTYQLYGVANAGTIQCHNQMAAGNCYFHIEDVGPSVSPPLPMLSIPTPWTPVIAFQNSWVNYGSTWAPAAYRKVGDEVQLRGLIKNGTSGGTAFSLPVGYRPAYGQDLIFATDHASLSHTRVDIYNTGSVIPSWSVGDNGYCSLAGIRFSVS